MNNKVCLLKANLMAIAIIFCSFVSKDLYSMQKAQSFPIELHYIKGADRITVSAEVTYAGTYVNGDDLYVAAQSFAPDNFTVTKIEHSNGKLIADDNSRVFYPEWGDGSYEFNVYGK